MSWCHKICHQINVTRQIDNKRYCKVGMKISLIIPVLGKPSTSATTSYILSPNFLNSITNSILIFDSINWCVHTNTVTRNFVSERNQIVREHTRSIHPLRNGFTTLIVSAKNLPVVASVTFNFHDCTHLHLKNATSTMSPAPFIVLLPCCIIYFHYRTNLSSIPSRASKDTSISSSSPKSGSWKGNWIFLWW